MTYYSNIEQISACCGLGRDRGKAWLEGGGMVIKGSIRDPCGEGTVHKFREIKRWCVYKDRHM